MKTPDLAGYRLKYELRITFLRCLRHQRRIAVRRRCTNFNLALAEHPRLRYDARNDVFGETALRCGEINRILLASRAS